MHAQYMAQEKNVNDMDSDLMSAREITYPQIQTKYSRPQVFDEWRLAMQVLGNYDQV